jgi:hypothetical protein
MANDTAEDIRDQILSLWGDVTEMQELDHGHSQDFGGFPAGRLWLAAGENELEETDKTHKRVWEYSLEIVQDSQAKDGAQAENDWQDAIEATLIRF